MKIKYFIALMLAGAVFLNAPSYAAELTAQTTQAAPLRIAIVNFKTCVEKSKAGMKEQASFEAMKKQFEVILLDKEKALSEVASKFNDIDYLDSLSPEAEADLKRQYRTLNQEFTQQQNQFYQTLSQTNVAVIQKLTEAVSKAATDIAKKEKYDLILSEESAFFLFRQNRYFSENSRIDGRSL